MARQTPAVYRCIGRPELADEPAFVNLLTNPEMNEVVATLIGDWAAQRTAAEVFEIAAQQRAPFSLVATPEDLLANSQLAHQGFWQTLEHPMLGTHQMPGMASALDGELPLLKRSPLLGEHTAEVLAELDTAPPRAPEVSAPRPFLHGVRVLDLTQVWAGPYGARFLADMGADVIHIEGPDFADAVRGVGRNQEERGFDQSSYFNEYNRNKRGMALALDRPEGHEAFMRLVAKSDVVIENWSVGVAARLGVDWAALVAANPQVVFVQMPAFGQTGPEAARVGFGPGIEQMGGLVSLQGYEGVSPHKSGISYGDPNAGILAAGAVALGLLKRNRTQRGCHVVVRQRDNLIGMVGEYMVAASVGAEMPRMIGNRDPQMAPHGVYRCLDDEGRYSADLLGNKVGDLTDTWIAIAVDGDGSWQALKSVIVDARLDRPEYDSLEGRLAARTEIDGVLSEWAARREANATAAKLQAAGVSATPVLSPLMVVRDHHLNARQFFTNYDHPIAGRQKTPRPVWRLAQRPFERLGPAPCFGEHNREVLLEVAGYSEAESDALEAAGVITNTPVG
jgi:crotonobetainyl-CoA:carnitine CoA-transferase CaiB-like acyl-CoA transferase